MSFKRGVRRQIYTQIFIFITIGVFIARCAGYQCGFKAAHEEKDCLKRCNDECYNPKMWNCVENNLCPARQILCHINPHESRCYDPSRRTCTCPSDYTSGGDKFCKFQSPYELDCDNAGGFYCGEVCYEHNITSQIDVVCSGGRRAECRNGWTYCKNACHSPESGAKCYGGHTLCQKDEEYCKPNICFASNLSGKCYGLSMCRRNESICLYDCYDPSLSICYNGRTLCQINESICDGECYDPSVAICYNDRTLCQINESICDGECYDPSVDICYNNDTLCQKNQSICDYECYDPEVTICYNNDILCHKNQSICGNTCYDQEGEVCYDDVPCHKGNEKCGKSCYTPNVENCIDDRFVCRHGMQTCGDFCMWPHNEICHDMSDNARVHPKACPNSEALCRQML